MGWFEWIIRILICYSLISIITTILFCMYNPFIDKDRDKDRDKNRDKDRDKGRNKGKKSDKKSAKGRGDDAGGNGDE